MKGVLDVVAVVGLVLVGLGVWQWSQPAALVYSGIALVGIALVLGAGKRDGPS